jgi:hypothetical protein
MFVRKQLLIFGAVLMLLSGGWMGFSSSEEAPPWGFFGHRRINRLAVFTLPPEMIVFFKRNIEFVTEHAVDPDKRRYATKHEAVRHYIDIDHWGEYPFDEVPRTLAGAIAKYSELTAINSKGDSIRLFGDDLHLWTPEMITFGGGHLKGRLLELSTERYTEFFRENIIPQYYEDEWQLDCEQLSELLGRSTPEDCVEVRVVDHFSEYGVLPYNLLRMKNRLTEAFFRKDAVSILRYATDIGHYIGDAHVPLHTTENYNGQLTNQIGIHAFWESRLPELFADNTYDYFVGAAEYIDDPATYFWDVVLTSHSYLDSVLAVEKSLVETFPADKQFCYEERLNRTVRTQCKEYAAAYHQRLDGMVESRMQASIHSIGNVWYTCWVDAGKPNLSDMQLKESEEDRKRRDELEQVFRSGEQKGRKHDG